MLDTLGKSSDTVVMNNCNNLFRTERMVYCLKHEVLFAFDNAHMLQYHEVSDEVIIGIMF